MDPLISPFVSEEEVVKYMQVALEEARKAVNKEEVPVGCVFVRQGSDSREIVARSHNLTNEHQNASRHC